jgi:hypothetical protein
MPEENDFLYLDELYPLEVFKLMSTTAEKYGGAYLDEVKVIFPPNTVFGTLAALKVPNPYIAGIGAGRRKGEDSREKVFGELASAYREVKGGHGEPGYKAPAGDAVPLAEGLARLLLMPGKEQVKRAEVKEDEFLLVGKDIGKDEARGIFEQLSVHATHTRVSGAETRAGSRYLFYVKDDRQRRSTFQGLVSGEAFPGCQLLRAYRAAEFTIFLPPESVPGAVELDYFSRFVLAAPTVWGLEEVKGEERTGSGLLAGVVRWPGRIEFLFLAGLRFYDQSVFIRPRPEAGAVTFELLDLKAGEKGMDALGAELQTAAPEVGYRLELRTTRHLDQEKVERLYEEKARIEYQIAYRESITRPRPVLLRFTQRQLPALADVIRGFPMRIIHEGGLKYGFQATKAHPSGFHFIYLDPWEAAQVSLDPLPLYEGLDPWPMRFHLDPFWARYYFDQGGTALVFVPDGTALFPPIHDWDRQSMDVYLREVMQQWFAGEAGVLDIPANPVFVFDGAPKPRAEIRITVLDRDELEPLHMRLGWLNDNLTVAYAVGIENLVTNLAKDITWQEIYRETTAEAEELRKDFETAADGASRRVAEVISVLTSSLTEEVNRVVGKTFEMSQKVKELDGMLKGWEDACREIRGILEEVDRGRGSAILQTVKVQNEFYNVVRQIEYDLAVSQRSREEIERKIAEEINKLKESYKSLRKKLK